MRPYDTARLESLLDAGVTIGVQEASSLESNFREATSGPFKEAWDRMKNNSQSFVRGSRAEAHRRMLADDRYSYFDSLTSGAGTEAYQTCKISPIEAK